MSIPEKPAPPWRKLRPAVVVDMTLDRRRSGAWPRHLRWWWKPINVDGRDCIGLESPRGRVWQWQLRRGSWIRPLYPVNLLSRRWSPEPQQKTDAL